jgi:hypothetical protein
MNKLIKFFILLIILSSQLFAQDDPKKSEKYDWDFNASVYSYFIPEDFFLLPILTADQNEIHLEARYNYEDRNTFSGWIGYNFQTGSELEFKATPMIAAVVGKLNGVAPGLEIDLLYSNFELYSESEYVFNFEDGSENYFYVWSELTYSPIDWAWVGLVGQRTRAYQSELDIQRGILLGLSHSIFEATAYMFNIGTDDYYFMLSLAASF